ncbi:ferredoxin [Halobacteriales archaeon QS_1_68_20]|nr:MAG: ferredoxin [Halobacteriales archaeon QS_1_68_20]
MITYEVELAVPETVDADLAGESRTIEVDEDEYVLAAARAADVWLPADCQQGWCTTCAAELLEGEVDHSAAKRYYDVDRRADLVLLCVAKPRSDLRVLTHQQEAMLDHRAANSLPPGRSKR